MSNALTTTNASAPLLSVPEPLQATVAALEPKLRQVAAFMDASFWEGVAPEDVTELVTTVAETFAVDQQVRYIPEVIKVDHKTQEFIFEDKRRSEEISAVITFFHETRGVWVEGDASKLPICSSLDGVTGRARPDAAQVWNGKFGQLSGLTPITWSGQEHNCATCALNVFGTDPKTGAGMGCKQKRRMFIMRDTDQLPAMLNAPSTSFKYFDEFASMLRRRGLATGMVIARLGLEKAVGQGQDYSKITFRFQEKLTGQRLLQMQRTAKSIRDQAMKLGIEFGEDYGAEGGAEAAPAMQYHDGLGDTIDVSPVHPNQRRWTPGEAASGVDELGRPKDPGF